MKLQTDFDSSFHASHDLLFVRTGRESPVFIWYFIFSSFFAAQSSFLFYFLIDFLSESISHHEETNASQKNESWTIIYITLPFLLLCHFVSLFICSVVLNKSSSLRKCPKNPVSLTDLDCNLRSREEEKIFCHRLDFFSNQMESQGIKEFSFVVAA